MYTPRCLSCYAGIMDQSAILASEAGKLTVTSCLTPSVRTVAPPWPIGPGAVLEQRIHTSVRVESPQHLQEYSGCIHSIHKVPPAGTDPPFRILLAFSGIKAALASATGFNTRVGECRAAAAALLASLGRLEQKLILGSVTEHEYLGARDAALAGVLRAT